MLWSVMIPAYNPGSYLAETLRSVLREDIGPDQMQVEVLDDCSTRDDVAGMVAEVGQGRVRYFRQPQNVGLTRNFNSGIQRAQGRFVHILHADDIVNPGFYAVLGKALTGHPELGAAFCRAHFIDGASRQTGMTDLLAPESGIWEGAFGRLTAANCVVTPSIVVPRNVYQTIGGFDLRLSHTTDWEMWTRIASRFPVWYQCEPLAGCRVHEASDTSRLKHSGGNIVQIRKAIRIIGTYTPRALRVNLVRARAGTARHALYTAALLRDAGDRSGATAQAMQAVMTNPQWDTVRQAAHLFLSLRRKT